MTDPMRFASGRLRRGLALLLALSLPAQAGAVALERIVAPAHFHVAAGATIRSSATAPACAGRLSA
ncbi:MAG TPA: hypothetical protein VNV16_12290, partial [Methylibium sp.]|nr:hypothetical protein [Methylibium sp.]